MAIDYSGDSVFRAPIMRLDDAGHGFVGVVYDSQVRQASDYESGKKKWFSGRSLVLSDTKPDPDADPVNDYIFHIAVEKGRGAFTKRDENGDPVKLSSGKNATEVRDIEETDIDFIADSLWLSRAVKSVRLNDGHRVRIKRTTPGRDENGDRMTSVNCEIEVLETVTNPKPYTVKEAPAEDMYGAIDQGDPF